MVTDRQARRLMKELGKGTPLATAGLRSGMSENTARKYRGGALPSQRKQPRTYRTRPDPFAGVWPEIEGLLQEAPGLEAATIFETLGSRPVGTPELQVAVGDVGAEAQDRDHDKRDEKAEGKL